ncbi:hypothetical protein [Aggregatilinea lenta]|uniref:hypothetical protein n=1 Tax=Aggregatilinea lenta TaxID=913108 RepID=UPI000E5C128E|nr:hypothetical protein [Aggregatilinea lenta]
MATCKHCGGEVVLRMEVSHFALIGFANNGRRAWTNHEDERREMPLNMLCMRCGAAGDDTGYRAEHVRGEGLTAVRIEGPNNG